MTALFVSYVCDHCDGLAEIHWYRGYIVFRGEADFARKVDVFPTRTDAALYRQANGWQLLPIREVRFEHPVTWKQANAKRGDVTLAARPFDLHRDHRFESVPYSAYLIALPGSELDLDPDLSSRP
jgi:hypothetical protein